MPDRIYDAALVNLTWARAIVSELARAGVRHVCVSPGARSAPLALAVSEQTGLSTSVHVDERSAGFFALGYARAAGEPAAALCTSGTAAANLLPAVIEAHYARVPLVVLTADRPPELRDTGAWQAIDQLRLYGAFAKWFCDVAPPSNDAPLLRYARSVTHRAVATARARPAGPVHLNLPFREPLVPDPAAWAAAARGEPGGDGGAFGLVAPESTLVAAAELVADVAERIARESRGLIVVGPMGALGGDRDSPSAQLERFAEAVAALAAHVGYPILAEAGSGLRYGPHDRSLVVTGYDGFLRAHDWCARHAPSLVVRLGRSLTWRYVAEFLGRAPGCRQIVVDADSLWDDPTRRADTWVRADPAQFCRALLDSPALSGFDRIVRPPEWLECWLRAGESARRALARIVAESAPATAGWVYPVVLEALREGGLVFCANSMAVRDLDAFSATSPSRIRVLANRGAAGIDGTVSSGLGAALGSGVPTVVITGDLAFVHDLNGLAAARATEVAAAIVVMNDGGGGIFAHLAVAELPGEVFGRFFRTPSGVSIADACRAYGVPHEIAVDPAALRRAFGRNASKGGVRVVEVPLDMAANTMLHRRLWDWVCAGLG